MTLNMLNEVCCCSNDLFRLLFGGGSGSGSVVAVVLLLQRIQTFSVSVSFEKKPPLK